MTTTAEMHAEASKPGSCRLHGDFTSMRFTFGGRELWSECPSCDALARDQHAKSVTRQAAEQRAAETGATRSATAQIPARFAGKTLDGYQVAVDGQRLALKVARRYLEKWADSRQLGRCLVFSGWPGTGKTHLAAALAQAVVASGGTALFRTMADAIGIVKAAYDGETTEAKAYARLRTPELLVLDDVGAVKLSEHDAGVMFRLINMRYEDQRPTILTTNLDEAQLTAFLGDRIMDRLRENGGMLLRFEWESYRK